MILALISPNGELCAVDVQDLIYLQVDSADGLRFYSYEGKFKALSAIKEWAALLQEQNFIQVDRGTIVNVGKVKEYNPHLRVVTVHTSEGEVLLPVAEKVIRPLRILLRKT